MKAAGIRSIIRNSGFLLAGHGLTIAMRGVYIILLARLLGPEAYGNLNYGLSWYLTAIALTNLGLDVVLSKEIARGDAAPSSLVGATLQLRAGAALLVSLLSTAFVLAFESNPILKNLILVFNFALAGRAVWLWCVSVFTAFENTRHAFVLDMIFRPLEILAVLAALFLTDKSLLAIAGAHAALWCLQPVIGVLVILRRITRLDWRGNWTRFRSILISGLPGAVYTLALSWFMQAPIVLYEKALGTGDRLGHFALGIQIIGYLIVIPLFISNTALPVLTRSALRDDGKDRRALLALLLFVPAGGVALGVLGAWLTTPVTLLLFGEKFLRSAAVIGDSLWLFAPFSLSIILQQFIFARWRSFAAPLAGLLGAALAAGLFFPLVRAWDYRGGLIAVGVGLVFWMGGLIAILVRKGALLRNGPLLQNGASRK